MSDFTHARICIRHSSGSVEIQAPAGEVTWLDLSGLHAASDVNAKLLRRRRPVFATFLYLGCSFAAGAGLHFASSSSLFSSASHAQSSALERPALLPDITAPIAGPAQRVLPGPAAGSLPQPAAPDADPFGLKR